MVQILVNGLVNGALLAVMAISLTIIFSILRVPHFGLGGIFVWGAFVAYFAVTLWKLNFLWAMLLSAASMAALGVLVEKGAFKRLRASTEDAMFVSAIGVLIALENGALLLWGDKTRSIPVPQLDFIISIPGILRLPAMRVVIFIVAGLAIVGLHYFVKKTRMGKAMRAVAQDRVAARLLGIPIDRVASYTFALGSAMAAVAGTLVGAAFTFSFDMGSLNILKAFVVVVLGGLGSVGGAIIGGFFLGVVDSFTLTYITSEFKHLVSFSLLILVLVLRPSGLFGQKLGRPQ
ncbi:MAG TPA: branched-chain amino acid ABC transporter permease [Thermodesulfobacteriota bacterium]|nr:branched-chain amino acid ABC transporter permease [Thermodesulfobacteriota bacterium]